MLSPVKSAGGSCFGGGWLVMLKIGSGSGVWPPLAMLRGGRHSAATCRARVPCSLKESKVLFLGYTCNAQLCCCG